MKKKIQQKPTYYTYNLPEGQFTSQKVALDPVLELGLGPYCPPGDLIWGSLIADGYCNKRGCITLDHSVSQAPYVFWKWENLARNQLITKSSTPRLCHRFDCRTSKWTRSLRFNTRTLFLLERGVLYIAKNGGNAKKCFPPLEKCASRWTPGALAVWYMDDGGRGGNSKRGCVFDVSSYAPHGLPEIKRTFCQVHKISTSFQKDKKGGVKLYILAKSYQRFRDLVAPYITPSMKYKISHLY